ncbi:hypothetical protein LINPERHAP1_LOCUS27851 [Linum perenne]
MLSYYRSVHCGSNISRTLMVSYSFVLLRPEPRDELHRMLNEVLSYLRMILMHVDTIAYSMSCEMQCYLFSLTNGITGRSRASMLLLVKGFTKVWTGSPTTLHNGREATKLFNLRLIVQLAKSSILPRQDGILGEARDRR